MGTARLGDWRFSVDPNEIRWGVKANLSDKKGLGGKVVQVLSVHYEAMTVSSVFTTWEEQAEFVAFMKATLREDLGRDDPTHFRFLYPPRKIDFTVAVMNISEGTRSIEWTPNTLPHPVNLSLQIIGDATGVTTRLNHELIDDYINRFSQDFGWKRTQYNGPISAEAATEYAVGMNQRQPRTGADRLIEVYAQQGMNTPTPGRSQTNGSSYQ